MAEGIGLGMGFKLDAKSHLDVRKSFKTVEEMKNFPETSIPEGFTTFNEATGLEYQFLSTNEVSETLGKWRVKEYKSVLTTLTKEQYDQLVADGSITIDGETITYSDEDFYVISDDEESVVITPTINSSSTDSEVPTALAVEKRVKNMLICPNDKSPKEFALENCKSGQVVEFVQWGGTHADSVSQYVTYKMIRGTDPNWSVLVATIYDTDHRRTIKYCPYDGHRDDANKWGDWQRVVTTKVDDVPITTITWESTSIFSGEIASYEVRNGICYVSFRGNPIIQSGDANGAIVATGLPKPIINGFYMTGIWNLSASVLFQVNTAGNLLVWSDHTNNGKSMHFSFSYPVAES